MVTVFATWFDVIIKATSVDGVYSADPKKDPSATRYTSITFDEAAETAPCSTASLAGRAAAG